MGGPGSGRRYWFHKKEVTADCRFIDVRQFYREGLLNPYKWFSWAWRRDNEVVADIDIRVFEDELQLKYRVSPRGEEQWRSVDYIIPLTWTNCYFGGRRPWFICPCSRRVAKLFLRHTYFLCRHCHNLSYESRNEGEIFRKLSKAQDIRLRLGGSANMFSSFPERPKGMHRKTYQWYRMKSLDIESALYSAMLKRTI